MPEQEFVLFNYFRSSASYRVRIALALKSIAYEYRAIHLLKNDHYSDAYTKLNPSRQVPTLVHRGQPIAQSMAIIDYLDHIKPEPKLFPSDPLLRARVLQICEAVNTGAQPLHNLGTLRELGTFFGADQEKKDAWTVFWISKSLETLERLVAPTAGLYCMGNTVSAADCFVIPNLANADRFKIDVHPYPTLLGIRENAMKLEAFAKSAPSLQPDAPPA